jgi:hypothetical protein
VGTTLDVEPVDDRPLTSPFFSGKYVEQCLDQLLKKGLPARSADVE